MERHVCSTALCKTKDQRSSVWSYASQYCWWPQALKYWAVASKMPLHHLHRFLLFAWFTFAVVRPAVDAGEYSAERLKELKKNTQRYAAPRPSEPAAGVFKLSGSFKPAGAPAAVFTAVEVLPVCTSQALGLFVESTATPLCIVVLPAAMLGLEVRSCGELEARIRQH